MLKESTVAITIGVLNALGVATSATIFGVSDQALQPFIGTTVSAFIMAVLGALLAMGVAKPLTPRSHMWLIFVASFVLGAGLAALTPHLPVIGDGLAKAPAGPMALLTSFFSRWALPVAIEEVPKRLKSVISGSPVPKEPSGE